MIGKAQAGTPQSRTEQSATLAYPNDLHLNPPWHRKPWFLALVAGATILVVVTSIFTVASLARDVSRLAQQSHNTNEVLRVVSVVQTELGIADGYRSLGSDLNTSAVVDQSLGRASIGLTNLNGALEDPILAASVEQDLSDYVEIAAAHLSDPTAGTGIEEVDGTFDRLTISMLAARADAQEQLEIANSRMNAVAAVAAFAIAFLVPGVGLYLWEALRRTRGRERVLERRLAERKADDRVATGETIVRRPTRLVDIVRASVDEAMVPKLQLPSRDELSPDIIVAVDGKALRDALVDLLRVVDATSLTMLMHVAVQDSHCAVLLTQDGAHRDPNNELTGIVRRVEHAGGVLSLTEIEGGYRYTLTVEIVAPTKPSATTVGDRLTPVTANQQPTP